MKIKLEINAKYKELEIHICHEKNAEEVAVSYQTIKDAFDTCLLAYDGTEVVPLSGHQIIRIFSEDKKVYVATDKGQYRLRERLYELEEKLDGTRFLRISNSEIVNLKKIERLDTSFAGTVKMFLKGNMETYVSRRYVAKIKKALGV